MAWYLDAPIYDLKTNLTQYIRALNRGAADIVLVKRYGRQVAVLISSNREGMPALPPVTDADREMWRRARFVDNNAKTRRGRPDGSLA